MIISDFDHISIMPACNLNKCSCYPHFDPKLKKVCIDHYEKLRKIKKEERKQYFKMKQISREQYEQYIKYK